MSYYTVYNNVTDMPVMIHGTAKQCAEHMGLKSEQTFYQTIWKVKHRNFKKWYIKKDDD